MMIDRARREVGKLLAGRGDLGRALAVRKAHDRIGVGNVKIVADQRHSERRVEVLEKNGLACHAAAGGAQQRDAVRARHASTRARLYGPVDESLDALGILGPRRPIAFGDQHVAVGQKSRSTRHPKSNRQSGCGNRLGARRPTFCRRDVDGRDQGFDRLRQARRWTRCRNFRQFRSIAAQHPDCADRNDHNDRGNNQKACSLHL